ncbi:SPL family radical SAM protein [Deferribacter abyssi]|uniref:SPL family radical SAM protein n=1 Tax=Deferribacter abyssi TaxID=213806 RepID=UPI003C225E71
MIYVDKASLNSLPVKVIERKGIPFEIISEKDYNDIEDVKSNIFITSSLNKFVHPCPATKNYRCCNYQVVDAIEGCPYDCKYCILQVYLNHEYIKIYSNLEVVEKEILELNSKGRFRLGTGELSDSLALDNIFEFSKFYADIVNHLENIQFEFKTKSKNIDNLLNLNPKNIVVSWSLNPDFIIKREEIRTTTLLERINAAKTCAEAGFKVSFHFDPLIYYDNFEKGYADVIEMLFENIPERSVEFISVSTFRFIPELYERVREKFDDTILFENNFIVAGDGKMRYFKGLRVSMLRFVIEKIRSYWKNVFIYFCMEQKEIWDKLMNFDPGERKEFEKKFPWYS